jgi:hypothetical protein
MNIESPTMHPLIQKFDVDELFYLQNLSNGVGPDPFCAREILRITLEDAQDSEETSAKVFNINLRELDAKIGSCTDDECAILWNFVHPMFGIPSDFKEQLAEYATELVRTGKRTQICGMSFCGQLGPKTALEWLIFHDFPLDLEVAELALHYDTISGAFSHVLNLLHTRPEYWTKKIVLIAQSTLNQRTK